MELPWLVVRTQLTVVGLSNGDTFLHSPIAFDAALAARLQSLGRVRHLVSPQTGAIDHISGSGRGRFPTPSPGPRRAGKRARSLGVDVRFQRDLQRRRGTDWRDEIDQTIIRGAVLDEVVFFHRDSKTLIVADTIMISNRKDSANRTG